MCTQELEELNEDVAIMLCLAVCSDGVKKTVEEDVLKSSAVFTKEIASNYSKYIKMAELLQKDGDLLKLGFFSKIVTYSDKLQKYPKKRELYNLLVSIVFADNVHTPSEDQFLSVLRTKWNIDE